MKKELLAVARIIGDLKISINGEAKISLDINGVRSISLIQTLTGDQGNIYPFDSSRNINALNVLKEILKNIDIVPYQNDSRYEKYATKEANDWIKNDAWNIISDGFLSNENAFQVSTSFVEEGEKEPSIVIFAEIVTNDYVNGIFEVIKSAKYIGEIINSDISSEGQVSLTIKNNDGKEAKVEMTYYGDMLLFGIDSVDKGKYYYINDKGSHILTSHKHNFQPKESSKKIIV